MNTPARVLLTLLNAGLGLACLVVFWSGEPAAEGNMRMSAPAASSRETPWVAPSWVPPTSSPTIDVLPMLDGRAVHAKGPSIRSPAAIVADLDRGEILWARDPDTPRSLASLTKLIAALTLAASEPDLDATSCVTLAHWPSRPGARSKFETGSCHSGWEYLGAALVASDNRGAFSLPNVAGEEYFAFVERMGGTAAELGLRSTRFADPAGLEDENLGSARDALKAVVAVSALPDLAIAASAPTWRIESDRGPRLLRSTNRLAPKYDTLAAKTGYTDTAHYCFAIVARAASGATLAAAVLGAPTSSARFADAEALLDWAERADQKR